MLRYRFLSVLLLLAPLTTFAQRLEIAAPLPPLVPWNGNSRDLMVKSGSKWITPAEESGLRSTPNYDATVAWLRRLVAAAPDLRMVSIGKSGEGRDIWMVVASKERSFDPERLRRSGKAIVLAQAGIHAGEIDGKDAGLMFLRDLTVGGRLRHLLDRAIFLFVPIYNVDGHERASRFGRINQRGPEVMGWRTTARNLNLNRDYTKLDAPESRAMVEVIERYEPDVYVDLHVTDGADYQYDVTFGWNETTGLSPRLVRWMNETLRPVLLRDLSARGHVPGDLVFPIAGDDVTRGLWLGNAQARLSHGYGDVRHVATVLVENHSLKPYDQRVLGMLVLLETVLRTAGESAQALRDAREADEALRPDPVPLAWRPAKDRPDEMIDFLGIESKTSLSPVSGALRTEWLGRPMTVRVPVLRQTEVAVSVPRARAYWIPPAWSDIADRVRMHGIRVERITRETEMEVEMYRLENVKLASEAFEGHVGVSADTRIEKRRERFPVGSFRISTDQPLGDLAAVLLEPASSDSFLRWGFFPEILQRTEYIEAYMAEPLAEKMLAADPLLAAEFQKRIEGDPAFRSNAQSRLDFFYRRTAYADERWMLYPIGRER